MSGEEDEIVYFFNGVSDAVFYTLKVEGGCPVQPRTCTRAFGGIGPRTIFVSDYFEPGTKVRLRRGSDGFYGIECDTCADECKYTVTDVRP